MVGGHHRLNGHEFDQTPGDSEGQGGLVCCNPWGCKESDATEQPTLSLNVLNKNLLGKESGFKTFSRCLLIDSHG